MEDDISPDVILPLHKKRKKRLASFAQHATATPDMKVIIQIPCYNEAATLAQTVADIPLQMAGIDQVEILVVDDGSHDNTTRVAQDIGVHHVIRHRKNRGLAATFQTGIESALLLGADIIVNTDGDNQYPGADIPRLIAPILAGRADVVIGDRQVAGVQQFSSTKRRLSRLGSMVVARLSGLKVEDAVSGFRAISRDAAMRLHIVSSFSYTIEMLIQISHKGMALETIPISINPKLRESRLFRSIPHFIAFSGATLLRIYTMFRPLRVYSSIGTIVLLLGLWPVLRFLHFYWMGDGEGHIQSLVLGGSLLVIGFVTLLIGLVTDLVARNRQLSEMILERVNRMEAQLMGGDPSYLPESEWKRSGASTTPTVSDLKTIGGRSFEKEPKA